ncbi:meteorin-like protein [Harpegnathos saltator]|uniref:Meteorin-like protein n=1 Tax=Harpegnathos saltator TaxID=610380 RepID=E2BLQ6_HARSA|nr:meteorin-like protein [Harpegnathos saltator]EFN83390.1 Meteorin-like protein [Harpegnathos saltator]
MLHKTVTTFVLFFTLVSAYEHTTADQCDWSGSGGGEHGGVRPVYLRCARGTVLWRYPRGALRVVLSFPASSSENSIPGRSNLGFRACVKISGPVRVFLEGNGKLRPLYSPSDGKHELSHRCFHSRKLIAALYMEAEDDYSYKREKVRLQYDLEPNSLKGGALHIPEEEEECRPCSMEELAKAYCQSDLVARGTVSAVQQRFDLEAEELVLRVTKILRQVVQETEGNETVSAKKSVRVRVPAACDARHGLGEFVIMAKRRLGDLILVCAPRLEAWANAVREMDTAPCVLNS